MQSESNKTPLINKVLVCITAQSNSKRLIKKGALTAKDVSGELHVLHVKKGNNIFDNEQSPLLLQQLFNYASENGGIIHMYCDENIPLSIAEFIKNEQITHLVLGTPPTKKQQENQLNNIINHLPKSVDVLIVERENKKEAILNAV